MVSINSRLISDLTDNNDKKQKNYKLCFLQDKINNNSGILCAKSLFNWPLLQTTTTQKCFRN